VVDGLVYERIAGNHLLAGGDDFSMSRQKKSALLAAHCMVTIDMRVRNACMYAKYKKKNMWALSSSTIRISKDTAHRFKSTQEIRMSVH
jgi:hypothetical protein